MTCIPRSPTRPRSWRSYDISIRCWKRPIRPSRSQPAQRKQVILTYITFNRTQARYLSHVNAFPAPQSLRADLRSWQGPHRWRLLHCCRRLPLPLACFSNALTRRYPSAKWTLTTALAARIAPQWWSGGAADAASSKRRIGRPQLLRTPLRLPPARPGKAERC